MEYSDCLRKTRKEESPRLKNTGARRAFESQKKRITAEEEMVPGGRVLGQKTKKKKRKKNENAIKENSLRRIREKKKKTWGCSLA